MALLARETKSYTDSWEWFLQNCWEGNANCRADYAQEVSLRLRLERLLQYGADYAELLDSRKRVRLLDQRLSSVWQKSDTPIIGTHEAFSPDTYWWLYGQPHAQNGH